jgi:hypothetical protein
MLWLSHFARKLLWLCNGVVSAFFSVRLDSKNSSFHITGFKHFRTAIWKPFKKEFQDIKTKIEMQRKEVDEEIKLAAQLAADAERRGALVYRREAKSFQDKALKELNQTQSSLNIALKGKKGNAVTRGLIWSWLEFTHFSSSRT